MAEVGSRRRAQTAVAFQCERNPIDACLAEFRRIRATLADSPFAARTLEIKSAQAAAQGSTNRSLTRETLSPSVQTKA